MLPYRAVRACLVGEPRPVDLRYVDVRQVEDAFFVGNAQQGSWHEV